jgi:hypothetical protein
MRLNSTVHGSKNLRYIIRVKFLDQLGDYQLLKKVIASWSYLDRCFCYRHNNGPNFVVDWLTLRPRIREVPS